LPSSGLRPLVRLFHSWFWICPGRNYGKSNGVHQESATYGTRATLIRQAISNGTQKLHVLHIDFVMIHSEDKLTLTCAKIRRLCCWHTEWFETFSVFANYCKICELRSIDKHTVFINKEHINADQWQKYTCIIGHVRVEITQISIKLYTEKKFRWPSQMYSRSNSVAVSLAWCPLVAQKKSLFQDSEELRATMYQKRVCTEHSVHGKWHTQANKFWYSFRSIVFKTGSPEGMPKCSLLTLRCANSNRHLD